MQEDAYAAGPSLQPPPPPRIDIDLVSSDATDKKLKIDESPICHEDGSNRVVGGKQQYNEPEIELY